MREVKGLMSKLKSLKRRGASSMVSAEESKWQVAVGGRLSTLDLGPWAFDFPFSVPLSPCPIVPSLTGNSLPL